MKYVVLSIASDLRRKAWWSYQDTSWSGLIKAAVTDGTTAMVIYRLMQGARQRRLRVAEMLLNKLNVIVGGCVIGRGTDFGPGLVLVHSNGVVINGSVRGGYNVTIEHQVTIGAEKHQVPVIGNNVFIGAGAKIIGAVTIGDNARIGANAVVVHDVPPDTTVVGIPARPVVRDAVQPGETLRHVGGGSR
jgi:serine O-acetyltransferase